MAIRRLSTASIKTGSKSNKLWDQDTAQGAMVPLATISLATFDNFGFYNIPSGYKDLMIIGSLSTQAIGSSSDWLGCFLNSDGTASNYSTTRMYSDGASTVSNRTTSTSGFAITTGIRPANTAGYFGTFRIHILDYSSTSSFKNVLTTFGCDSNGSGFTGMTIGTWRNTAAVNTVWLTGTNNYPGAGSTVTIYGIKAGA